MISNVNVFFQELWAHTPSTRRRKSEPIHQTLIDTNPNCSSNVVANTHLIQTNPAHSSSKGTDVAHDTRTNINKPRWYEIFVRVNNILSSPKKPMPIGINNSFFSCV